MNKINIILLLLFFSPLFWSGVGGRMHAQSLDKIGKKDMVTVNGGLNY